jgi:rhamnosyltransferase
LKIGKFNESLFIDQVDHDYCFRLKNNGYKNSPLNEVAYQRELSLIPQGVLDYFNRDLFQ